MALDLSNIKIDILEKDQNYIFQIPTKWLSDNRLSDFVNVLKSRDVKGIIIGEDITVSKLTEIFKNLAPEMKEELLQVLGYHHVNPLDFEPQTK